MPIRTLHMSFFIFLATFACPLHAQQEGRWIKGGTFATSGYAVNPEREGTFRGSERENRRVSAYLPGMTIVYGGEAGRNAALGYSVFEGNTQSGVPVAVISNDVSQTAFDRRPFKDVVVHQRHLVCKQAGCDETDKIPVGIGQGYRIDTEDSDNVILTNADELTIHYGSSELNRRELQGFLTRHADRVYPRLQIREGYAKGISLGCGAKISAGTSFSTSKSLYSAPETWDLNSEAWTIKAIELFELGVVEVGQEQVTATLSSELTMSEEKAFALDVTVFSFEDIESSPPGSRSFAGLLSVVVCEGLSLGRTQLSYVDRASFRFENTEIELPQQLTEDQKRSLAGKIGRSFLYSFNSADSYFEFLPTLAASLGDYHHAAFVISRLNATCARSKRPDCDNVTK